MKTPITHLSELSACSDAVAWVRESKSESLEAAWLACERGDWMLWYAGKKAGPVGDEKRKKLVLAACACARLALPIFEKRYPDDKSMRDCLDTAEKWARNEATLEALQVSRGNCYAYAYATATAAYATATAAYATAYATATATAAYATAAATYATAAATHTATAATYAAAAATHTATAATYAAYSATKNKGLKECADIVRTFYPELPT